MDTTVVGLPPEFVVVNVLGALGAVVSVAEGITVAVEPVGAISVTVTTTTPEPSERDAVCGPTGVGATLTSVPVATLVTVTVVCEATELAILSAFANAD